MQQGPFITQTSDLVTTNEETKSSDKTSNGWSITAIVVGIVFVLGGIFGGLGLFQTHYHFLPSSFDWLATAIKFVGNTPHNWSLWALAVCSVPGVMAIIGGAIKVHQARMEERIPKVEEPVLPPEYSAEQQKTANQRILEHTREEEQKFEAMLGDNFASIDETSLRYEPWLSSGNYSLRKFNHDETYFVVIRTHEGVLKCTRGITQKQSHAALEYLNTKNYQFQADPQN